MKIMEGKPSNSLGEGGSDSQNVDGKVGDDTKIRHGSKDAFWRTYHNVVFDYEELKEDRIGPEFGRWWLEVQYDDVFGVHESACCKDHENGFLWEDRHNPTSKDQTNIQRNVMEASEIVFALSSTEYDKVATIKNANQLWRKPEVIHEGIHSMKDAKLEGLKGEFNDFIMGPGQGPKEVHDRLMRIVNQRRALEAQISDLDINKRLLQALRQM